MKVDIYIDTDMKGTRTGRGHVWYQLSAEHRGSRVQVQYELAFDDHNLHGAVLEGLLNALRHLNPGAEVTVHSDSSYVASNITNGNIYLWEEREYMSAKGLPIRYTELWKQIMALVREKCGGKIAADTSLPVQKILEMTGARKH